MNNKKKLFKRKLIMFISFIMMLFSVYMQTKEIFEKEVYNIKIENIDIKNMAPATTAIIEENTNIVDIIFESMKKNGSLAEATLLKVQNTELEEKSKANEQLFVWKLPTEMGTVSQNPSYYHTALDITSPRTYNEPIYSIARGVITSIYTDLDGGLTVSVLHNYNGINITSHYVHFSRYADIYVGKEVTEYDILGYMGSTGNSTGPHLHISVVDCGLFVPGDPNCYDLNSFFNYKRKRFNEGLFGLGNYIYVPYSWNSR